MFLDVIKLNMAEKSTHDLEKEDLQELEDLADGDVEEFLNNIDLDQFVKYIGTDEEWKAFKGSPYSYEEVKEDLEERLEELKKE